MSHILKTLNECEKKVELFKQKLPLNDYRIRLEQIDYISNTDPNLWTNPSRATKLMKERKDLNDKLGLINSCDEMIQLYKEFISDTELLELSAPQIEKMAQELSDFEFQLMFDRPEDKMGAIISISSGAGGLEASNWTFMLLRMYLRYCEDRGWKTSILDEHRSEENSATCIDSITIEVVGEYAYGNLKGESGVHRLIRNSPFSSADARHTSFAAVQVLPDLDDEIEVKVDMKDLEITAQTGKQSAGGQNANKVASCALFHHIPSGIKFRVQTERSLEQNKATGLKMLKSKLYNLELEKRQKEEEARLGNLSDVAFGSQIRTYTFTPYQLVKDHRTSEEANDIQSVMNGNLQRFIKSYLTK